MRTIIFIVLYGLVSIPVLCDVFNRALNNVADGRDLVILVYAIIAVFGVRFLEMLVEQYDLENEEE